MRAHKRRSLKDKIFPFNLFTELPSFVHTKVSKFYPFMRPPLCNDDGGRQHYINIIFKICISLDDKSIFNGSLPFGKIAIPVNIYGHLTRLQINYTISVKAKYKKKSRRIIINTVIHLVGIDLYIENEIKGHWYVRFIALTTTNGFHYFLEIFIKTIIITISLNGIYEIDNTFFLQIHIYSKTRTSNRPFARGFACQGNHDSRT